MKKFTLIIFSCLFFIDVYSQTSTENLIIDKPSAKIYLGSGGNSGPHEIVFDDPDGSLLKLVYRTTPNQLIVEDAIDESDIFSIDAITENIFFSGFIGIGTPTPRSNFVVNGTAGEAWINQHSHLVFNHKTNSTTSFWTIAPRSNGKLGIGYGGLTNNEYVSNSHDMITILSASGNVGIGTTEPNSPLHVSRDDTQSLFILERVSTSILADYNIGAMQFRGGEDGSEEKVGIIAAEASEDWTPTSSPTHLFFGTTPTNATSAVERMRIDKDGNVGIGTTNPQSKLAVEGEIRATRVKVLEDISVPDYVFEEDYELSTLEETKEYIATNKHLPEIPSAAEIGQSGINLGEMDMRLLKKIEELTLHLINQNEKMKSMQMEIDQLKKRK